VHRETFASVFYRSTTGLDALMWSHLVIFANPQIEIGLQLVDRTIHLLAKRDTAKFVEHGFVEALADAVGLRALGLGAEGRDGF
jgi:hypothetical protein